MKHLTFLSLILIAIVSFAYAQKTDILEEGFEGGTIPGDWTQVVENSGSYDDLWEIETGNGVGYPANAHTGTSNVCVRGFPSNSSTKLITPEIDLSNGGTLNFWWAAHTALGPDDTDIFAVYYKIGSGGEWILLESYPDGSDNWTEATFSLPASNEIYIAFEGTYKGGLGTCVDDIHVFNSDIDLGITDVQPTIAFGAETNPKVTVRNFGLVEASSYTVTVTIDGIGYNELIDDGAAIAVGEEIIIEFPIWTLPAEGSYEITATVEIEGDAVGNNNSMTIECIVDQTPMGNLLGYFEAGFAETQDYHCAYPETDGEHIYVGEWSQNKFKKYTMNGTPVGEYFEISDLFVDDLAFDGQYFYSGHDDEIHQLDLANQTLISTIETNTSLSTLSFNDNTNTFWANQYHSSITEINPDGTLTGNNISIPNTLDISSSAIDMYSDPESPTIWLYEMGAAGVVIQLIEYNIETGNATGRIIPINETAFPGIVKNDDQAGGLACYVNAQNQVILLVGVQHLHDDYNGRILFVYLDEAANTYSVTLTVVDDQAAPLEDAYVQVGSTKIAGSTDEYGQITFNLPENTYEYMVVKDCYTSAYGDFEVDEGSPTIEDIVLNPVNAPILTNAIVLNDGETIEATFNNEMDLNGQSAPAGFSLKIDGIDNLVTDITLKNENANIIVLTIENIISSNATVLLSYSPGEIQSVCELALEEFTDEHVTNNSTVSITEIENNFSIYPNPSTGIIFLNLPASWKELVNVKITDVTGKLMYNTQPATRNSKLEIDISNQPAGIYFITIKTKTGIYTKKLIIQ